MSEEYMHKLIEAVDECLGMEELFAELIRQIGREKVVKILSKIEDDYELLK